VRKKEESGQGLCAKSADAMMDSRYGPINEEQFVLWLKHFQKNKRI
jgi:hypothetical protein